MNYLDYIIIVVYSIGLLGLGFFFKNQKDTKDYFLGGRSFGWFSMGMSTMASQLSAISFISAAAFAGLKVNGGMKWITFEFAVPLAMIFLIVVLIPPLYKAGIVSIYSFLEKRFSGTTRVLISLVFQFSRAFATGIMIYTVALVLSAVMNIPFWQTILLSGLITIIYSYQGGMKAVVWGDVIQMIILVAGIVLCIFFGLSEIGGWDNFVANLDRSRLDIIDHNLGANKSESYGLLPMIIGGFFLYISYYGCDQSQAQRSLSGKSLQQTQRALLFNGLFRFPVTICYLLMGLIIGTFALTQGDGALMSDIVNISQSHFAELEGLQPGEYKADLLIPIFIANYLPNGLIGLLLVAILAAAMSSLSSAINSLSAATVEDIIVRRRKTPLNPDEHLKYSKYLTIAWGVICIILAFSAGGIDKTVVEAINKVGSVVYGPIVATFILAILTKKTNAIGANAGLLTGVIVNIIFLQNDILFWIWWNFTGAIITIVVAYVVSLMTQKQSQPIPLLQKVDLNFFRNENYVLVAFFGFMLWFSMSLAGWF